ncbi:MAG: DEAD/DEAH box helicase [Planctomycetaceae bacterium]|nr:DEAD/DEAH box helicase [Planctomycetaceae bacterium]
MTEFGFHPLIAAWFAQRFAGPTEPQRRGWPVIQAGGPVLIAAPTGSGKTLTAFLSVIDRLFRESEAGTLGDEMRVVYLSPLRALSNDMQRNLEAPLREIADLAATAGLEVPPIRVGLRTGDTSAAQRATLIRKPPHVLVTTPESLYLLLTSEKGREALRSVETVIVDEIHALVRDKRGSHLALSLERLEALTARPIQRIGLSATQKPLDRIAAFLIGERGDVSPPGDASRDEGSECKSPRGLTSPRSPCAIVDVGHQRQLDLALEIPVDEIGPVCTHEQWAVIHQRMGELIQSHRSTLIFVNTRRMAERLTHQLSELIGAEHVSSHHGSLSAEIRQQTEHRLKTGDLKAVVATASLELGLDVGYIDLVIQLGSSRSIATFLQRIGRSGHSLHAIPKGRILPLSRDELLECMALIRAIRQGTLDEIRIPVAPLDVLVQQIVAETTCEDWDADELFALCRRAYPYRDLSRDEYEETLKFLSEGLTERAGRGRSLIYYDRVGKRIRARPVAKSVAIGNAGAIPETGQYRVVAQPEHTVIGSVDEDFAVESMRGDVFLLGNTSWQIEHVRQGDVVVHDAHGAPPTIPFWFGEAPGRTIELSTAVSDLRDEIARHAVDPPAAVQWVVEETTCPEPIAEQVVSYIRSEQAAIGLVPSQLKIVFERFFNESGGMQLVVHAPFGAPITRAWGYAMRKRFCRSFDFELQATADDDGFILSLGPQHSFPIESLFGMLTSENVAGLLEQAILVQPPFHLRWRWNVTRALLVQRSKFGKKVPPALQRFRAEDLLTSVFPQLTGCLENHTGDIELPDHPLVRQTMHDCLHEAMDLEGLKGVLRRIESGEIQLIGRDTREPSPFCYELLNAYPYAFLDGGELQERRSRVVSPGSELTPDMPPLDWLDPLAIEQVVSEASPLIRHRDELHDFLLTAGVWPTTPPRPSFSRPVAGPSPSAEWETWLQELTLERRAFSIPLGDGRTGWIAVERFPAVQTVYTGAQLPENFVVPEGLRRDWDAVSARIFIARGWLEFCGPVTAAELAAHLAWSEPQTAAILEALEGEGAVLRGRYRGERGDVSPLGDSHLHADKSGEQSPGGLTSPRLPDWCHRRLLARIHRRTLAGLRQQIEPVDVAAFQRFLFEYHGLIGEQRTGVNGLYEVLSQLQGLDLSAAAWERDLLPMRLKDYQPTWLDDLCLTGEAGWGRLYPPKLAADQKGTSLTRVVPLSLFLRADLGWLLGNSEKGEGERRKETRRSAGVDASSSMAPSPSRLPPSESLSSLALELYEHLQQHGASFATDLFSVTRMLPTHLEEALGELISRGLVTADTFVGLRSLIAEKKDVLGRPSRSSPPGMARKRVLGTVSGRWSIWRRNLGANAELSDADRLQAWAWQLIRRWGVVFRDLIAQEDGAPRWWELAPVFRRLEARGELRGGRFITGVAGEQFALESTIAQLRRHRNADDQTDLVCISAVDPLNLVGVLTPPPRIPSQAANKVAYLKGAAAGAVQAGEILWLMKLSAAEQKRVRAALQGWEPQEIDDPHGPQRRKSKAKGPEYPGKIPRPLIS